MDSHSRVSTSKIKKKTLKTLCFSDYNQASNLGGAVGP